MKQCKDCGEFKPLDNFGYVIIKGRKPYYKCMCNTCNALRSKRFRQQNPEKIKQYENNPKRKKYLKEFKETYNKQYYEDNKESIIKQHIQYEKEKYKKDLNFRLLRNLRTRFRFKTGQTTISEKVKEYLGCSLDEFKQYLESKFQKGMVWENYGAKKGCWSIDHIKPCSSFDLTNEEEIKKCFHYTNCQPLWVPENSAKGNKII